MIGFPSIALVTTILFGWLLAGSVATVSYKITTISAKVFKTDYSVFLLRSNDDILAIYKDVQTFNRLKNESKVEMLKTEQFNLYGGVVGTTYILK